ncbi:DUF917 domain-containing protein [Kosmotoga sp.]|uniref:DUF917 domain-containing protein n=1 Tax=Kosmotoga sp. TaxID=1955248 RepID=UPI0024AC0C75|nr:DUF917 domain-containing protein [Kosmotoga sp.]MDI3524077.1 uncharacterized protein [Kosmotoga sp.]
MTLSKEDLKRLVIGSSFFGCGGGGTREEGFEILKDVDSVELVDLDELSEEGFIASPYACGSLDSETKNPGPVFTELRATIELQKYAGTKFAGLFPTELGGYNTAVVFKVAHELGIPVVDGDGAGRSVPEIHHSLPSMLGFNSFPCSIVFPDGDIIIVKEAENDKKIEGIVRQLVSKFGNLGVCDHPMRIKNAKEALVKGSLTKSLKLGSLIVKKDLEAILRETDSKIVGEGIIKKVKKTSSDGFTEGETHIGNHVVYFKNENMILNDDKENWKFPDLIILLDQDTLLPVENPPEEGKSVYILVSKADPRWYKGEWTV